MTTERRDWLRNKAPRLTHKDWRGVEFLDAELDVIYLALSTGDIIGKPEAGDLLAYRKEVAEKIETFLAVPGSVDPQPTSCPLCKRPM